MPILALLAAAFTFFSAPAAGQYQYSQSPQCFPHEIVFEVVNDQFPIRRVIKLEGKQLEDIVFWWNSQPPATEDKWDTVYILQFEGFLGLALGNNGEICQVGRIPEHLEDSFLDAMRGRTADKGA